ncbi:MAG: hypothetical protein K2N91_08640, partial [Muribaculaceae bacterium]|nr:hypothetical protein [Muribaculaceae bacterium]
WVVFVFFFMTGIAIVLYLNQPPMQPRERDYAFAGSFYAFAIWIGIGVYTVWQLLMLLLKSSKSEDSRRSTISAIIAGALCIIVPIQMVSQTWDDHDRSGRYTTRDYGMNYLSSLDDNAIIFTNGDNDTFPLWYAQEVEGYRTDVRVINLAYLGTEWYANHAKLPSYNAAAVDMLAEPIDYAYNRLTYSLVEKDPANDSIAVDVFDSLRDLYKAPDAVSARNTRVMRTPNMYIPVDIDAAVKAGVIKASEAPLADDYIRVNLAYKNGVMLNDVLSLDMIASGIKDDWKRPAYFAMTVPDEYYLNMQPNLRNTGLAYMVSPIAQSRAEYGDRVRPGIDTDKMYNNVMTKFRWGGLDKVAPDGKLYLDETVRRMVSTHRIALTELATQLVNDGIIALHPGLVNSASPIDEYFSAKESLEAPEESGKAFANDRFKKAADILYVIDEKLPERFAPYALQTSIYLGSLYAHVGQLTGDKKLQAKGKEIITSEINRYAAYVPYFSSLLNDEQRRRAASKDYFAYSGPVTLNSLNLSAVDTYA